MTSGDWFPGIKRIVGKAVRLDMPFIDFASHFAGDEGTVLLLSGGGNPAASHSILALFPVSIITCRNGVVTVKSGAREKTVETDPFSFLKDTVSAFSKEFDNPDSGSDLIPEPVSAGLFGYLSYDLKDYIEKIPYLTIDEYALPEMYLTLPRVVVVRNNITSEVNAHYIIYEGRNDNAEKDAERRLTDALEAGCTYGSYAAGPVGSNFTKGEYTGTVTSIIDYIKAGDIYQVNMSQRFSAEFSGSPFALFRDLFSENPAEFFSYMNCGDHYIVSTSPERFIKQQGRIVEARPIKGTRPRGKDEMEDMKLRRDLAESGKDDAELSMIVDLLRNDIGKVCKAGSVRVAAHKKLESFTNVHHLVSIIEGTLDDDKDSVDLVKASFPGGSITGCPKVRAMEIIEESETVRRHIYTGSIGYIGFQNNMDLSIAIRTAVVHNGRIFFSAGGGIVFDSIPEDEYDETLHKAESFMKILGKNQADSLKPMIVWHNGKTVPLEEAFISADSAGFQYGKGVFETMLCKNGKVEYLQEHLNRMNGASRKVFGENLPGLSWEFIIEDLLRKNRLYDSAVSVKIIMSENGPSSSGGYSITVMVKKYIHRLERLGKEGLDLGVYPETRNNFLFSFKTSNYLFNHLAGIWAEENGYDEAVILNTDGTVSETNTANILIFTGRTIIRPVSPSVLPGIMERSVLDKYSEKGYHIERRSVYPEDLVSDGNEVYITNSLIGMVPVSSVSI